MSRLLISLLTSCAFLLFTCLSTSAQTATATLSGTISDQNSAVIPGTNITIVNEATSFTRSAITNHDGSFTVSLLPPGTYTLTVRREGFSVVEMRDIVLNLGDQKAIRVELKIGDVNAAIEVRQETPLIDESPAVGTVVDRTFVENLPLNGRSFNALIELTPGVILTKATSTNSGQFSVNGQRPDTNYFTVDGVSANVGVQAGTALGQQGAGSVPGLSASGGTNNLVSVDALQEFRIQTSTYAPEFGRQPGGQVQILTRSGTNGFRGTLFEYFRNDALDANDWFANANRLPKPAMRQNDFGGVFGGPIIKNRTFFFFSYEALRLRQPLTRITEVPSLTSRQSASPQLRPYFDAFPLPNGPNTSRGLAQFSASYSDPTSLDATSIRVDHTLKDKITVFGRYNYAPSKTVQRAGSFGANSLNTIGVTAYTLHTATIGTTWVVTSAVNNEIRANWSRNEGHNFAEPPNDFGGAVPLSESLMFPTFTSINDASFTFSLTGVNASVSAGLNADNVQRQINLVDNLSVIAGSHQLKFGFDYRRLFPVFKPQTYTNSYAFNGATGALTGIAATVVINAISLENRFPLLNNFEVV